MSSTREILILEKILGKTWIMWVLQKFLQLEKVSRKAFKNASTREIFKRQLHKPNTLYTKKRVSEKAFMWVSEKTFSSLSLKLHRDTKAQEN